MLFLLFYFPPPFNASHLIVTGVEANHTLKNTNPAELLSKTKTAGLCAQKSHIHISVGMSWEETECSKWCLFVCERMCLAGEGGTLSFIAALSLAESLQSLNRSPSWAPAPNIAASPPLPRSSSLCTGSFLSSFA